MIVGWVWHEKRAARERVELSKHVRLGGHASRLDDVSAPLRVRPVGFRRSTPREWGEALWTARDLA